MNWKLIIACALAVTGSTHVCAGGTKRYQTLEDAAVAQARKWQQTGIAKPIMSDDGKILYPFGQYMPTITCAPLRACDIELEPGEVTTDKPKIGDPRFIVGRAFSGLAEKRVTHVTVKPQETNIETNLIVYTDRRTYHLRLYSSASEKDYLNRVGFYYPEDMATEWDETARATVKQGKEEQKKVATDLPPASISSLDFSYRVEGDAPHFKPLRVFNDGAHVYLEMPPLMKVSDAPILVAVDKNNNMEQVVNMRPTSGCATEPGNQEPCYWKVDLLFDKAVLMDGPGGKDAKVTLTWLKTEKKSIWPW